MVAVDIEVQDDLNAVFSITQKPESSSYYTLDKPTAKAGGAGNGDLDRCRC